MEGVFGIALSVAVVLLILWILFTARASSPRTPEGALDPEKRWGVPGRRVVAGLFGFGMAGLSAAYGSANLSDSLVILISLVGAVGAAWWAGISSNVD